jgi:hypothetical protein
MTYQLQLKEGFGGGDAAVTLRGEWRSERRINTIHVKADG